MRHISLHIDLRYKNGNTVAISENWYQILCGPKSSPRFQNVQGSDASTRLKTGGEPRSCAISQASFYVFYANFFQVHNNLLHLSRQNKQLRRFSFSYEGVVEGRSRESTGKAFAAPVDRPPLSLTHHLTPQMCPLNFSRRKLGNIWLKI